jgi:hypothetical protein
LNVWQQPSLDNSKADEDVIEMESSTGADVTATTDPNVSLPTTTTETSTATVASSPSAAAVNSITTTAAPVTAAIVTASTPATSGDREKTMKQQLMRKMKRTALVKSSQAIDSLRDDIAVASEAPKATTNEPEVEDHPATKKMRGDQGLTHDSSVTVMESVEPTSEASTVVLAHEPNEMKMDTDDVKDSIQTEGAVAANVNTSQSLTLTSSMSTSSGIRILIFLVNGVFIECYSGRHFLLDRITRSGIGADIIFESFCITYWIRI